MLPSMFWEELPPLTVNRVESCVREFPGDMDA